MSNMIPKHSAAHSIKGSPENWNQKMVQELKDRPQHSSIQSLSQEAEPLSASEGFLPDLNQTGGLSHAQPGVSPCLPFFPGPDPIRLIKELRQSSGAERIQGLMSFQSKLDEMSSEQLKEARNYLTDQISSPVNRDDELLGAMLKAVNHELDSRQEDFPNIPRPIPFPEPPNPFPDPISPTPFPDRPNPRPFEPRNPHDPRVMD